MPCETSCCDRKIRLDNRHSSVRIFTKVGVSTSYYYHGTCLTCKTKHYHNFTETKNNFRTFFKSDKYFITMSSIGFSRDYLDYVSLMISIGSTSLEKICQIYNAEHGLSDSEMLRPDILEKNWLIYRISNVFPTFFWRKTKDHRCDVEKICQEVYPSIRSKIDEKWINHSCDEIGCKSRMVVIDGNEKIIQVLLR